MNRFDHRVRVDGETYWLYRLQAEMALVVAICAGLLGSLALAEAPSMSLPRHVGLAAVVACFGFMEWLRLRTQLREQRKFANLFCG